MKRHKCLTLLFASAGCALALLTLNKAFAADSVAQAYKLYQEKRYKEAAQMFEFFASTPMPDPNVCYYAALSNQAAGNTSKAKTFYKQVVYLSPNSTIAQYAQSVLRKLEPGSQYAGSAAVPALSGRAEPAYKSSSGDGTVSGPDEGAVYYRESNNQIWVPVEINNRSIEMELDTGAPSIFVGKNQLEKVGLRPPEGNAYGVTGGSSNSNVQSFWIMPANVRVGPFSLNNTPVKVVSNNYASPLLGQAFLQFFDYTVDQSAKCIRFKRKGSGTSTAARQGYPVPFIFQEAGNRIIVDVELNGKKYPMMLDTGNSACTVSFMSVQQATSYGCRPPADATIGTHHGVSGSGRVLEFTATRIKLGPIDKSNVRVSANMDSPDDAEAPLLGHDFFEGWQYNIDLKGRTLWLLRR
ncbi:MAG TPA: retroviral-like aspartic protease family protein [Candidatus Melainabacteria bacterium]|nr:retroviral-like aspartic protease family protein [Candidatus Melainabacteria bacterium]